MDLMCQYVFFFLFNPRFFLRGVRAREDLRVPQQAIKGAMVSDYLSQLIFCCEYVLDIKAIVVPI